MLDHTPIQEKDWWTTNLTAQENDDDKEVPTNSNTSNINEKGESPKGATQDSVEMHFHNRGFEVWEHCRSEWRNYRDEGSTLRKPTKPLSSLQRRAVLSGLSRQREDSLPRRIRLEELVDVYQDIWHQDNSD